MNRVGSSILRPVLRQAAVSARPAAVPMIQPQRQLAVRGIRTKSSGMWDAIYDTFMSSTSRYITAVVLVAIGSDLVFNKVIDAAWEANNRGRLYHHIDWSQFKEDDDDDDEDEDDE